MRKVVNFVIDKKYVMLALFILSAVVCVFLSSKVNINYDISHYLPESSDVNKGLEIMEKEFPSDESSFYVMFDDLKDEERSTIPEEIRNMPDVKSVDYDASEKYNIENHTLYKVTVNGDADSDTASSAYQEITKKYKDYKPKTSGDVSERNKEVLPKYVLVAAVAFGTVILIVMCNSVVEVFLFLFTILIAVLLNKGTNIMFSSVSNITDSISAILQLALSMDYSIMLMNRFNQAREKEKDITKAMKDALYSAVSSITSSSITTVVGLLALIFMSFTIGRDLGLVLAKGVLCSLIATFFVLPGLILIFHKAIDKTRKKVPTVKMDKLARFSYRFRFVLLPLFVIIFVASFFLKGSLNIGFLETSGDEVFRVFTKENEIAVVYNNQDEDKIKAISGELANNQELTSVMCYGNTIDRELKYNEMNGQFKMLGANTEIEDYLLRIIYYKCHTNETNTIDIASLFQFIQDVVYPNPAYPIDAKTKEQVTALSVFANKDFINQPRSAQEIAAITGMEEMQISALIAQYNTLSGNATSETGADQISIKTIVDFLCNVVIQQPEYSSMFDDASKTRLMGLQEIMNDVQNDTKLSSQELMDLLAKLTQDVDPSMIEIVYLFYGSCYEYDENWTMTIEGLVTYLNQDVLQDSRFDSLIQDERRTEVAAAGEMILGAKRLLVGQNYSRMIITSNMSSEGEDVTSFVSQLKESLKDTDSYIIGNSPMAIEINEDFDDELNLITILTMAFIFIVVALTFRSNIVPVALVLTIQCSVFTTMGILSLLGTRVYFISLLVVQAVLMGATIDYAIVYSTYYLEYRKKVDIKEAMIQAYNRSIHTIVTSSLILCSCTLIVALFTSAASAKICETIAEGAFCSTLLIIFVLPGVLASIDKIIMLKEKSKAASKQAQ